MDLNNVTVDKRLDRIYQIQLNINDVYKSVIYAWKKDYVAVT